MVTLNIVSDLQHYDSQLAEVDKMLEKMYDMLGCTLTTIPGVNVITAVKILAEIGDINRFKNQAALAKYAGLAWSQHQSGDFEAEHTHLIQSGNRFLKYYLCEGAWSLVCCDTNYKHFYDIKYKEVNRNQHKRALALTARKFARLIFSMLKNNRLYIAPVSK